MKGKLYYGWVILAAAFAVSFVVSGAGFTFSLFILPISRDLGWSIGSIAGAMAIRSLLSGFSQPLAGGLISRYGHKRVIGVGLLIMGLNTFFLSYTRYLWQFYLMFGVLATIGAAGGGLGPISALVSRWFQKRRTFTIAIANTGMSAGQFIIVPLVSYFLLPHGWRLSWMVLGAMVVILTIPLALFIFKNDPREVGCLPDGEPLPKEGDVSQGAVAARARAMAHMKKTSLREAMHTRTFWLLAGAFFVCGFTAVGIQMVYLVPYAVLEVGISEASAGIALGIMGGTGVVGILAAGYLGDKVGKKNPLAAVYLGRGLSFLLMMNATEVWHVYLAAAVMGTSFIATVPLTSALTADNYGSLSVATIFGTMFAVHQVGAFVGTFVGGWIMGSFGSLYWGWMAGAFLLIGAAASAFLVREHRTPKVVPVPAI